MVRWVVGSILHGGPIELFLVPASALRLLRWVVVSILHGGSIELFLVPASALRLVRWVVGSILHGVDPMSYFSFQPVLHDWCNKGCGMCYPVCWMVHIKEPLLLTGKSSPCGSRFPLSLSEWSFTICLTPYNRK